MSDERGAPFDVAACRAHLRTRQEQEYRVRETRRQAALQSVCVAARSVLPRFPRVRRAYLFGSVLRPGSMRSTSDVDVAIEGGLTAEEYFALWRELESAATGWLIDLVAFYLHNLYCAFEDIFQRVAEVFGNQLSDQAGWHAELLRRMTLDIEGLRPRLLSEQAYDSLDELRRFRHLFRRAYRLRLDAERLALTRRKAQALEQIYRADVERFLAFLDSLVRAGE